MGPVKTEEALEQCCGAGSRWSRNYLGPGAGAEIKFLLTFSAVSSEDATMKISSFIRVYLPLTNSIV